MELIACTQAWRLLHMYTHSKRAGSTRKDWETLVQVCCGSLLGLRGWPAFYQLSEMALSEWEEYKSLNHCAMNEKELKARSSTADRERNAALPKGRESKHTKCLKASKFWKSKSQQSNWQVRQSCTAAQSSQAFLDHKSPSAASILTCLSVHSNGWIYKLSFKKFLDTAF